MFRNNLQIIIPEKLAQNYKVILIFTATIR